MVNDLNRKQKKNTHTYTHTEKSKLYIYTIYKYKYISNEKKNTKKKIIEARRKEEVPMENNKTKEEGHKPANQ